MEQSAPVDYLKLKNFLSQSENVLKLCTAIQALLLRVQSSPSPKLTIRQTFKINDLLGCEQDSA